MLYWQVASGRGLYLNANPDHPAGRPPPGRGRSEVVGCINFGKRWVGSEAAC
jgi:hypothetical protein